MPIEMPKGLPFSVDTWSPPCSSRGRKRHHFLTHAHKDHSQGITAHASYPIYATQLTKSLVLQHYPQIHDSLFVCIEIGQTLLIDDADDDDPHRSFSVTAFDANHCPGAVMFLFEGHFGNILHTGDCRLTTECLQSLPEKYVGSKGKEPKCRLDFIFLDCTFGRFPSPFPSKQSAIQQVINCIWKHPNSPVVYLSCDLLGQEEVLVNVSRTFGCKIYVDKETNSECYQALELLAPEILSSDPCSRFQVFDGFHRLYERAQAKIFEARAKSLQEPLIIRPSVQWYAFEEGSSEVEKRKRERFDEAVRDLFGVWHVCYSSHSSREELEWALQLLAPKWVVSTTPSCRAMELDYVKKHCFTSKQTYDGPLWRLLDIGLEASSGSGVPEEDSNIVETNTEDQQPQLKIKLSSPRKPLNLSPPSKRPCVTLFGRARLGPHDSVFKHDQEGIVSNFGDSASQVSEKADEISFKKREVVEAECRSLQDKEDIDVTETKCESVEKEIKNRHYNFYIGSSSSYSERLRKLYRSMNVPVPQPLPSLVKLLNGNKYSQRKL